ncbi:MAG: phosphoribosylanthranilate isomerase [Oscillospiraceae bacterium]|nr:phosphoribosylanthranilate isomerase [Oscillospiraceae bacterium]
MTKIKLCGLTRPYDIEYVNGLLPEYIGFVFAPKSRRYISAENAERLRIILDSRITPVGVFVDEKIETIADLVKREIIDIVQLHGNENDEYIANLRKEVNCPIIKAFRIESNTDIVSANNSSADYVLLDSGGGTGKVFDHSLLKGITRPYFLAGGLTPENVGTAIQTLHPYAVDASSSLETDGFKDKIKMTAFVKAVRKD